MGQGGSGVPARLYRRELPGQHLPRLFPAVGPLGYHLPFDCAVVLDTPLSVLARPKKVCSTLPALEESGDSEGLGCGTRDARGQVGAYVADFATRLAPAQRRRSAGYSRVGAEFVVLSTPLNAAHRDLSLEPE